MSVITVVGNLVSTPEVRFTPSGNQMTTGTVVENHGYKDKVTNEWVETEPTFWPFVLWGEMGGNAAESLAKGDRVIVVGETRTNTWDDKTTGEKRSRVELNAREIAVSFKFAQARVVRRTRAEQPGTAGQAAADSWGVEGATESVGASDGPAPF